MQSEQKMKMLYNLYEALTGNAAPTSPMDTPIEFWVWVQHYGDTLLEEAHKKHCRNGVEKVTANTKLSCRTCEFGSNYSTSSTSPCHNCKQNGGTDA